MHGKVSEGAQTGPSSAKRFAFIPSISSNGAFPAGASSTVSESGAQARALPRVPWWPHVISSDCLAPKPPSAAWALSYLMSCTHVTAQKLHLLSVHSALTHASFV